MKFCSIGSGSKGNGTLVQSESALVLIDCGFGLKDSINRLASMGVSANQLDAILVTHEHGDHINGVSRLAKKFNLPVYLTYGTYQCNKIHSTVDCHFIRPDQPFVLKDLEILPVTVPHDASEPCQFVITHKEKKLGILTDLGSISQHVKQAFVDCKALILEANHDYELLMDGNYPPSLKKRVAGEWGHLSNEQAFYFLNNHIDSLQLLVLAHISQQNNSLEKVKRLFSPFADQFDLHYACQEFGYDWLIIE